MNYGLTNRTTNEDCSFMQSEVMPFSHMSLAFVRVVALSSSDSSNVVR